MCWGRAEESRLQGSATPVHATVTDARSHALYADLHAEGLFSTAWTEESNPPVGGAYGRVTATGEAKGPK